MGSLSSQLSFGLFGKQRTNLIFELEVREIGEKSP